jgi:hypothetical protein
VGGARRPGDPLGEGAPLTGRLDISRAHAFTAAGVCLVIAAFTWNALDAVTSPAVSIEEGTHLVAARAAMGGRLPYLDFAYTPSAAFPYIAGPALSVAGFGAFELRCLNAALAALGLLVASAAFARRAGRAEVGIVAAFSVAASPHWMYAVITGGPVAAATLSIACACAAALSARAVVPRVVAFAAASLLAIGCEPIALFPLLPMAARLARQAWTDGRRVAAICAVALAPTCALAALLAVAPSGAVADLWRVHFAAASEQGWRMSLAKMFSVSPGAVLVLLASGSALPALLRRRSSTALACMAAGALGIGTAFLPSAEASVAAAPVFPIVAGAGLMAVWSLAREGGSPLRHAVWLAPLMSLYVPLSEPEAGLPEAEIDAVAAFVASAVPPGPILTPFPAVAAAARRPAIAGTELGADAVLARWRDRDAVALHLVTPGLLARNVEARRPRAIVLHRTDEAIDFGVDRETGKPISSGAVQRFQRAVAERYERAFTTDRLAVYVPRAAKDGGGEHGRR